MIYINLTYWFLFLALIQDWSGFILPLHGKFLCHTETPPLSTFLCPKLGNKLLITEVKLPSRTIYNSLIIIFFSSISVLSTDLPPCRSMAGSTRQTKTKLSSPPRETVWHFFVSAASWAPGRGTLRLWRGRDPGGSGWPSGRRAGSRTHCWAPRWWWTSFLQLWMLTTSLQMNV